MIAIQIDNRLAWRIRHGQWVDSDSRPDSTIAALFPATPRGARRLVESLRRLRINARLREDCGTGEGGFQPGNDCAKGGGGSGKKPPATRTTRKGQVLQRATFDAESNSWRMADGQPLPPHFKGVNLSKPTGKSGWSQLYFDPDPNAALLAQGLDSKGRWQPRYSKTHDTEQAAAKFARTRKLIKARSRIFKAVAAEEDRETADCLELVMRTSMRPGSDRDTKADHRSYGATTLEGRHILKAPGGGVDVTFVSGKNKGRPITMHVSDPGLASRLLARAKKAGPSGRLFDTNAGKVLGMSKRFGVKTKDFRTAIGTEEAARAIAALAAPTNEAEYRARLKAVGTAASRVLGNTPKIALKSYIDPLLFAGWKASAGVE